MQLRAYCDESGKANDPNVRVISMAIVVGLPRHWQNFEQAWPKFLAQHSIPYIHKKYITYGTNTGSGPFGHLKDKLKQEKLYTDLSELFLSSGVMIAGSAIVVDDLKKFNEQTGEKLDAFAYSLYLSVCRMYTMLHPSVKFGVHSVQVVLDKGDHGANTVDLAQSYFKRHRSSRGIAWPTFTILNKDSLESSRNIPGLQAADYVAWELRKSLDLKLPWIKEFMPSLRPPEYEASLLAWQRSQKKDFITEATPNHEIRDRKSFAALLTGQMSFNFTLVTLRSIYEDRAYWFD